MINENTLEHLRQQYLEKISEIERRQALLQEKLSQRSATVPQEGDIFVFKYPETLGIQWVVLGFDEKNSQYLLIVPADDTPMVGSTDVELPKSALCSPLTLRCDYSLLVERKQFDMNLRVGVLEERHRQRALDKLKQISEHAVRSSILQQETDEDLDYEAWMEHIYRAREVLRRKKMSEDQFQVLNEIIKILFNLYQKLATLLSPEKMVPVTLGIGILLGIITNNLIFPEAVDDPFIDEIDITKPIGYKGIDRHKEQTPQEVSEDLTQLSPEEWLAKSIDKIMDGDVLAAIELLQQFKAKYPNYHPDGE